MPELPEVETITKQLDKSVSGKKINEAEIFVPKIVKNSKKEFEKIIFDAKIKKIGRRAKLAIFELNNGWSLLIHLKLTGQLIFNGEKNKHTAVIFNFSDGTRLIFNDLRKFGYIKPIKTEDLNDFFEKEKIGPEPLSEKFALADFKNILQKRPKAKIKQFLMDPKSIAGIGNIYADEILFASKIHPLRRNQDLSTEEIKNIFKNIKKILAKAIELRGTSVENYVDAKGQKGEFEKKLKVYGREGEKCVKCGGEVKRIKIGGRSAHFCPSCQK
ncbi:MAG: Formamidopyrimidine-DNA glycosylase [Parcubacteria group bacterium GW2011_GWA1_42_7]|nr:MAG: Formamidopyrimidine-DNA glycosylase [Parcubacteria group bacterium GW2011_GWB1_42_6]KKS69115.1 MAG: Formamidopyrimidine-DNA glycosylase [Parcubacteria group bacterium GW2011_GWA1_42_7]KKS92246.1 MAG: Formamidopyrimidine-DNA glycosylase [Parcubacteria group bacterium GW2011_GWC1_43_12]